MNPTSASVFATRVASLALAAWMLLLAAGCAGTRSPSSARPSRAWASDAELRARVLEAIDQAARNHQSATNAADQAIAAESLIELIHEALAFEGWHTVERLRIQNERVATLKSRDMALLHVLADAGGPDVCARRNFAGALTTLDAMISLAGRCAEAGHWNETERLQWLRETQSLRDLRAQLADEFSNAAAEVKQGLADAQRLFVNEQGASDLRVVRGLHSTQNDKTFNWRILGHFRDDGREFSRAVLLCDRVLAEPRMDQLLNFAAAGLRAECVGRLGSGGQEIYRVLRPLPGYGRMAEYPSLTDTQIHIEAEIRWRRLGGLPANSIRRPLNDSPDVPTEPPTRRSVSATLQTR